jgi:hypothetical protein
MKDVSECIGEIGRSGSTIFSTIDLTSGFWQMLLQPKSRPYTAFTISGLGQFQWVTTPMGLLGLPASFQRLMETVVAGLSNIIVYILHNIPTTSDSSTSSSLDSSLTASKSILKNVFSEAPTSPTLGSVSRSPASNQGPKSSKPLLQLNRPQTCTKSGNFLDYAILLVSIHQERINLEIRSSSGRRSQSFS